MKHNGFVKEQILKFSETQQAEPAFSLFDGKQVTDVSYPQFARDILKAAGYFRDQGIRGKHISLIAPNSYEWAVAFFGILASGNVAIMMNQDLPADLQQWQFDKADIALFCSDGAYAQRLGQLHPQMSCVSFDTMLASQPIAPEDIYVSAEDETVSMLFTSGTTGNSKAVELTAENWRYSAMSFDTMYADPALQRISIPVPFYHALGLENLLESVCCGKTVCLGRGIRYLFMDLGSLNPSHMIAVPAVVESMVKVLKMTKNEAEQQRYLGRNLKEICFAGAALKEPVLRFMLAKGFTMSVNYGMSEIPGAATLGTILDEDHYATAGKFTPWTQYRFVDGELLLKSPTLMKCYYKDPEETAKVIEDGWIHTGDLGRCDDLGYFFLTGRKKNVIILPNGENVNPEEIEHAFGQCDAITESMVYGDGKGICADIFTADQETVAAFISSYNNGVPKYRQVYKINYTKEPLPKTGSGKIKRKGSL